MKFTDNKIESINRTLDEKKKANPYKGNVVGIGININDGISGATVFKDNWGICTVDELGRMIEELTMLRDSIEEETGLILR